MKRIAIIAVFVLLFVFLASCSGETITVEYKSTEGGRLGGTTLQTKELGDDGTVTLDVVIAIADEGYRFVGWDDGNISSTRVDTVSASATYTAKFEKIAYGTITYTASEGGEISGETTQTLEAGKVTTSVTAIALDGYRFDGWSDGVTTATRTDIVGEDKTITATFVSSGVTVMYKATEGGMIIGNATQEIAYGSKTTTVFASASSGYRFVGWDDQTYKESRQDTATEDIVYTAIFKKFYNVEFVCDSSVGEIIGSNYQSVYEGQRISTVVAKPKSDEYVFLGWSNGVTDDAISFIPEKNEYLTAYFARKGTGLPTISIDTKNSAPIVSKDMYLFCNVTVYDPDTGGHIIGQSAMIKGRGNSTWQMEKKPYRIKFDTKQELFGYGKAKDWVLLADHIDKSLVRNMLAYKVAGVFSELESSPDCQSVEVYLNGEYVGVYLLCEQVEVAKNRVEITDTPEDGVETGYLVEMDGWAYEEGASKINLGDSLNSGRTYSVKTPDVEPLTDHHKEYIRAYLATCLSAFDGEDYEAVCELVDVKSFAQAYIVFELFKNPDVNYSSFYMYKDVGGKLKCGPVWDFDMAFGNSNHKGNDCRRYDYLWAKETNPWFKGLFNFEEFETLVGEQLVEYKDAINNMISTSLEYAYSRQEAYEKNFERWQVMGVKVRFEPAELLAILEWSEHIEYNRTYLKNSMDFLFETYVTP